MAAHRRPISKLDVAILELTAGSLRGVEWLPGHQAFAIATDLDDRTELRLVDASGRVVSQIETSCRIPESLLTNSMLSEWEHLVVFQVGAGEGCTGLQVWDPISGQTGLIESSRQVIPLGTTSEP